jgi:bla regulator protein blaR1
MEPFINTLEPVFNALGWSLIHSLWQISIITALVYLLFQIPAFTSSKIRFGILFSGMMMSILAFAISFGILWQNARLSPQITGGIGVDDWVALGQTEASQSASLLQILENFLSLNLTYIVVLWLAGVLFFIVRMGGGLWYAHNLKNRLTIPADPKLIACIKKWTKEYPSLASAKIKESFKVGVPTVVGIIKPVILIPAGMATHLHPSQVEAILAHEVAHILRSDLLTQILSLTVKALLFYHPGIWWMHSALEEEREYACDEMAIQLTGNRKALAEALATVEEWEQLPSTQFSLAFHRKKELLLERIIRIMTKKGNTEIETIKFGGTMTALSIIMGMFFLLPASNATKREHPNCLKCPEEWHTPYDKEMKILEFKGTEIMGSSISSPNRGKIEYRYKIDTIPPAEREKMKAELAKLLEELRKIELEFPAMFKEAMQNMEFSKMPLEKMDFEKMKEEMERAMKSSQEAMKAWAESENWAKFEMDFKAKMPEMRKEMEAAKKQMEQAMKEIDMEGLKQELEKIKIEQEALMNSKEFKDEMEKVSIEMEKARKELEKQFRRLEADTVKKEENFAIYDSNPDNHPLFIVNGEKAGRQHPNLDPRKIMHMEILKGELAIQQFGKEGEHGVVFIQTTSISERETGHSPTSGASNINTEHQSQKSGESAALPSDLLFVIDGVVKQQNYTLDINPNFIVSIEVLKNKAAIHRFGEQGKNGVVMITTKKTE